MEGFVEAEVAVAVAVAVKVGDGGGREKEERDNCDGLHRRVIVLRNSVVEHRCQTLHHSLRHRGILEVNLCTCDSGLNLPCRPLFANCSHCQQKPKPKPKPKPSLTNQANDEMMPLPYHNSHRCKQFFETPLHAPKWLSANNVLSTSTLTNPLLNTKPRNGSPYTSYVHSVIPDCLASLELLSENLKATSRSWLDLDQVLAMLLDAYAL
jgi:hypothetical protein